MIKIIVAVSGLALAEFHSPNGPIDIYFPVTSGYAVPVEGLNAPVYKNQLLLPKHEVSYRLGKCVSRAEDHRSAKDCSRNCESEVNDASGFKFSLKLSQTSSGWASDWTNLNWFPRLEELAAASPRVRSDCAYDSMNYALCQGKDFKNRSVPLLAGTLRLEGAWKLVAAETPRNSNQPMHHSGSLAALIRVLGVDHAHSPVHTSSGRALGDTLVFEAEVDDVSWLQISNNGSPVTDYELDAPRHFCASWGSATSQCRLIWLENAPEQHFTHKNPFLQRSDPHFAQLYRLLEFYSPDTGSFDSAPFVPYSAETGDDGIHAFGDHSPRCYAGTLLQ